MFKPNIYWEKYSIKIIKKIKDKHNNYYVYFHIFKTYHIVIYDYIAWNIV